MNVPSENYQLAFTFNGRDGIVVFINWFLFHLLRLFVLTPMSTVFLFSDKKHIHQQSKDQQTLHYIHSVQKRHQNVFFCNVSYKTQAMLIKFRTPFPRINLRQNNVNIFHLT